MGALGKIINFTLKKYIVSFNDSLKDFKSTFLVHPYGVQGTPPLGTNVYCGDLNTDEKQAILGCVTPKENPLTTQGEVKIYNAFGMEVYLSKTNLQLKNGLSSITLEKDGTITIEATKLNITNLGIPVPSMPPWITGATIDMMRHVHQSTAPGSPTLEPSKGS